VIRFRDSRCGRRCRSRTGQFRPAAPAQHRRRRRPPCSCRPPAFMRATSHCTVAGSSQQSATAASCTGQAGPPHLNAGDSGSVHAGRVCQWHAIITCDSTAVLSAFTLFIQTSRTRKRQTHAHTDAPYAAHFLRGAVLCCRHVEVFQEAAHREVLELTPTHTKPTRCAVLLARPTAALQAASSVRLVAAAGTQMRTASTAPPACACSQRHLFSFLWLRLVAATDQMNRCALPWMTPRKWAC
jgi:hypothetical protein